MKVFGRRLKRLIGKCETHCGHDRAVAEAIYERERLEGFIETELEDLYQKAGER